MGSKISRRDFIRTSVISGAALGLGFAGGSIIRANNRFDTIIKGGIIYNGEGGRPYPGEIGIKDGKITAMATSLGDSADVVVDAKGTAVSPGFIDIHTHTDDNMFSAPLGDSKIYQGVTTDIAGNCGGSPFPGKKWENLDNFFGDMRDKLDPYLQPLYDALRDMIPAKRLAELMEDGIIQIAPLAYMRGRTLESAFVILDEAQNTTMGQLKMFLTRMGNNSKFIVTGDATQIDLPKKSDSGLLRGVKMTGKITGVSVVEFDKGDIVRHPLVSKIVQAFEDSGE